MLILVLLNLTGTDNIFGLPSMITWLNFHREISSCARVILTVPCRISPLGVVLGTSVGRDSGTGGSQHRDMDSFMACLRNHSLVALNSWDHSAGPTYFHGDHATRIDFILMRLVSCDGAAKRVTYLDQADFLPVNSTHHNSLSMHHPEAACGISEAIQYDQMIPNVRIDNVHNADKRPCRIPHHGTSCNMSQSPSLARHSLTFLHPHNPLNKYIIWFPTNFPNCLP